jgi:hypothetical protein
MQNASPSCFSGAAFLRFLEISGVGRFVDGGVEEVEAYPAKMDDWIASETMENTGNAL